MISIANIIERWHVINTDIFIYLADIDIHVHLATSTSSDNMCIYTLAIVVKLGVWHQFLWLLFINITCNHGKNLVTVLCNLSHKSSRAYKLLRSLVSLQHTIRDYTRYIDNTCGNQWTSNVRVWLLVKNDKGSREWSKYRDLAIRSLLEHITLRNFHYNYDYRGVFAYYYHYYTLSCNLYYYNYYYILLLPQVWCESN